MKSKVLTNRGENFEYDIVPRKKSVYNMDQDFWNSGAGYGTRTAGDIKSNPYQFHPWVYACARAIMINLCRVEPILVNRNNREEVLRDENPMYKLLHAPNHVMDWNVFKQTIILSLLLHNVTGGSREVSGGQCFIVPWGKNGKVKLSNGEVPETLMPFNDSMFKPVLETNDATGMRCVKGWKMYTGKSETDYIKFDNGEIIRIYMYNPSNILNGMPPFLAAESALDSDIKSDIYNKHLFENDGRVSGLLSTDSDLSEEQARHYKSSWQQQYSGNGNRGKIAVIGSGLKYQQFGLAQADLQWTEQKTLNRKQMLAVAGLNEIAIGNYEKINYATIREGRKMLWQETYIPFDEMIMSALTRYLVAPILSDNIALRGDYSKINVLREDVDKQSQAAGRLVKEMRFPPIVAARITGIKLTEEEVKKYPHLSEPPPAPGVAGLPIAPENNSSKGAKNNNVEIKKQHRKFDTAEEREGYSDLYIKSVLDIPEKSMVKTMRKFFYRQRNVMQDKIDNWLKSKKGGLMTKADMVSAEVFLFNEAIENEKLLQVYKPEAKNQMEHEKKQLVSDLGELIEWNVTDEKLDAFIQKRKGELLHINKTTLDRARNVISEIVEEAMKNGLTNMELSKKLKAGIHDVADLRVNNSRTIARTEMGHIASASRFDAFQKEGIDKQKWITSRDEKVRAGPLYNHRILDNETTTVGMPFPQSRLRYPRDPMGKAGDVINCRCVAVAHFDD